MAAKLLKKNTVVRVENPSIDLGAYRMRSGRSTNELVPRTVMFFLVDTYGHVLFD